MRHEQKLGYLRCPAVVEEMDPAGEPKGGRRNGACRLVQGPEEALARQREEERRGVGGARSADPVRGGAGAAGVESPTACRRGGQRGTTRGFGDGGREATVRGNRWSAGRVLMAYFGWA